MGLEETAVSPVEYGVTAAVSAVHYGPESPLTTIKDVVDADIRANIGMASIPGEVIPDARKSDVSPIFLLQPVPFNNHVFNLMYDSGCETFVCRKNAVDLLPYACKKNVWPGPITLNGVGGCEVVSPHGHYEVQLFLTTSVLFHL